MSVFLSRYIADYVIRKLAAGFIVSVYTANGVCGDSSLPVYISVLML
jgi:hypothetical protein